MFDDPEVAAIIRRWVEKYAPISLTEARAAVRIARRVRSHLRKRLPKEALKKTN